MGGQNESKAGMEIVLHAPDIGTTLSIQYDLLT